MPTPVLHEAERHARPLADGRWNVEIVGVIQVAAEASTEVEAHRLAEQEYERQRVQEQEGWNELALASALAMYHRSLSNGGELAPADVTDEQAWAWRAKASVVMHVMREHGLW